jgi:hypothetical protein
VGDGLPWNWSVWKHYFPDFVPILDFIHALSYLYAAALAMHPDFSVAWLCYLRMVRACRQGRATEAIDELKSWLAPHGLDDTAKLDDKDPRKPIVDAARYLRNNRGRMDYPHFSPVCATASQKQCPGNGFHRHCLFQAVAHCCPISPCGEKCGLPALPTPWVAGNVGPDGVAGQRGELPGEGNRDVLERSGGGRSDSPSPCRHPM